MTLQIENEQERLLPFDYEQVAGQVINQVLDMEACPYEAEVSLTLTDDDRIRQMNKEFRPGDRPTHARSFPMTA